MSSFAASDFHYSSHSFLQPWLTIASRPVHSAFRTRSAPHFRLPQLLEEEVFQRRVRGAHEKMNAAPGAVLVQAPAEILHGLPVGVEAIFSKSDLLLGAGLGIDEPQIPVRRG